MKRRSMLRMGILATTAAIAATAGVQQAEAAPGWQVSLLPLPAGYPSTTVGHLGGTDGHGGYSGSLYHDGKSEIVLWRHGKPEVQQLPAGFTGGLVQDENSSGTVIGVLYGPATASFVLDRRGFRILTPPAGVSSFGVSAINNRGDILGRTLIGSQDRPILWRAHDQAHPALLPVTGRSVGIDADGTILLNTNSLVELWKDGTLRTLASPEGGKIPYGSAIRSGRIVGSYTDYSVDGNRCVFWPSPDKRLDLPGCGGVRGLNRFGLIIGSGPRSSVEDPGLPAAWIGTRSLGTLPIPAGYRNGYAQKAGDDGTIAGIVVAGDPTYDNPGRPAIWHRTF